MESDEQAALLAQIQALSGAIDQRRSIGAGRGANSASSRGYYSRGGHHLSSYRGGRGRGGYSIQTNNHNPQLPSRHRTLVLSGKPASTKENEGKPVESLSATATTDEAGKDGWIKRKSTHNMSLVSSKTFEKTEPARLAAIAATQSAKEASKNAKTNARATKASSTRSKARGSIRRGDNMGEVIIDGVVFEFDDSGTKLVKKADQSASQSTIDEPAKVEEEGMQSTESSSATPLRTSVNGQKFIRTKTGNLISQALLDQRKENKRNSEKLKKLDQIGKEIAERQLLRTGGVSRGRGRGGSKMFSARKKTLCAHFNKTGQCKNGLSCPYKHDPSKLAICPRFLRPNGCPLPSGTCPLSHESKPERIPHCVHYLSTAGNCRNGDSCAYTHPSPDVHLTNESQICVNFTDFGWCQKGANCDQRHTWDCPEFLRKGKCDRRGCKLMHIVRVSNIGQDGKSGTRQLDDDDLFVRDDDAHLHEGDASDQNEEADADADQKGKRKRSSRLHERDSLDEEGASGDEEDAGHGGLTFKAKKTKVFSGQDDFISFNDTDGEDDEEDEEDDEAASEDVDSEIESVHSDLAEGSSEEEEESD